MLYFKAIYGTYHLLLRGEGTYSEKDELKRLARAHGLSYRFVKKYRGWLFEGGAYDIQLFLEDLTRRYTIDAKEDEYHPAFDYSEDE